MNWMNLPDAIVFKWGNCADTLGVDPETAWITAWRHPTIPQPTREQLEQAIIEYESRTPTHPQDWSRETGLAGKLFGSAFHQRLASCTSDACNKAYSELLSAIANKSVPLLEMGLKRAIAALPDTPSEIAQIQGWLNQCNIPITIQGDGNPSVLNVGVRL